MSSSSSSRAAAAPVLFKIVLAGSTEAKKGLNAIFGLYSNKIGCGIDFRLCTLNNIRYQVWDLAAQERFRTITNCYYRGAHTIVLCPTTVEELGQLHDRLVEVVNRNAQNIVVVTNEPAIKAASEELELIAIDLPNAQNLNDFLLAISNRNPKPPLWRESTIYAYNNAVISALTPDLLPQDISQLIFEFARPAHISVSGDEIALAKQERAFVALVHEAAYSKDPLLHLRLCLYYQNADEPELADAHFVLANEHILDMQNEEITDDTFSKIKNQLKNTPNEAVQLAVITQHFVIRQQHLAQLSNDAPATASSSSASSASVSSSLTRPRPFHELARNSWLWSDSSSLDPMRELNHGSVIGPRGI
jgi:hypothetical protein